MTGPERMWLEMPYVGRVERERMRHRRRATPWL
jgi:hypothetical protein